MTTPTTAADGDQQPAKRTADLPTDAATETPTTASETVVEPGAPEVSIPAPTDPPAVATGPPGQHAAPRPYPPVPPTNARGAAAEAGAPLAPMPAAPAANPEPAATPAASLPREAPVAAVPGPPAASDATTALEPRAPERPAVPDLPRRPGARRHLLGALAGFLLTPIGLVLAAMGVGHMVDLPAGDGALTDVFGLVLLGSGALLLGFVALLGRWSPAVPITAGVLWGIAGGGVALWDPQGVHDAVHGVTDGRFAQIAIDHILDPALTGSLLVLGLALLGGGIAAGLARRAGRSFGSRTVQIERVRAEAERLEAGRQA